MSTQLTVPIRIGSIPDTVTGSPLVESIEETYKQRYGAGVCNFLFTAYPEQAKQMFPGGLEECIATLGTAADAYFDKWKVAYPSGVVARAKATLAAAGVKP